MRTFVSPSPWLAAALRVAARLWPSPVFIRTVVTWITAVLAAALCWVTLHPSDSFAQVAPVDGAGSAGPVPTEPALKVPATPPSTAPAAQKPARSAKGNASQAQAVVDPQAMRPETGSTERLVWDKAPLQVALGVGPDRERSITFPAQMHVGVPQEVAPLLRVQTVGRTTYVMALGPFPRTRVVAEDRSTGAVILLDLIASNDQTSTLPITIVVPTGVEPNAVGRNEEDEEAQPPVDMVTLTRFAAQQMYAPRRLALAHPAIRRVLVDSHPLDDLVAGAGVRGTPVAQWRGDDFYVTAVVLQNLLAQPIELNPLDIRGRWRAITFQHGRLLGHGSEADTTVVYLVCERPFNACR